MSLEFVSHADRPDLVDVEELWREWPEFMLHDDVGRGRFGRLYDRHPDFQLWGLDAATGEIVAKVNCAPVALDPERLPEDGWREALRIAIDDDDPPTLLCALQIQIAGAHQGGGSSAVALGEMRRLGVERGLTDLVAPVRPSWKARYPLLPAERYAAWRREDGLPFDPWLRVHARAGARLVGVCRTSMRVTGTVAEWEEWAAMPFPETGDYVVPGALVPVSIDRASDRGVYVEPNVWMHHLLR